MELPLYDSHNHLQDDRLKACWDTVLRDIEAEGIRRMVVNGSCEEDWPEVLELSKKFSWVIPAFGYHPWYVHECSDQWKSKWQTCLDTERAVVGEIGLDRWIDHYDLPRQEEVFIYQLRAAAERNLPVSIHCLQAWGRLYDLLRSEPVPRCGFLLHSYGGPKEMVNPLAKLGAYFSFPGYFAHDRKERQREAFKEVPKERLLIETDAPDQLLPEKQVAYPLTDPNTGKPLNHPANLRRIYEFAAAIYEETPASLAARVEANFKRLFGER